VGVRINLSIALGLQPVLSVFSVLGGVKLLHDISFLLLLGGILSFLLLLCLLFLGELCFFLALFLALLKLGLADLFAGDLIEVGLGCLLFGLLLNCCGCFVVVVCHLRVVVFKL
jgi:hypothetical protein